MILEKIPQPKTFPGIGNLRDIDPQNAPNSFYQLSKKYGPLYQLELGGGDPLIILNSYEFVNEVSDQSRFDKIVTGPLTILQQSIGNGLFTADTSDPEWGIAHRVLMPTFGPAGIRDMYGGMLDIAEQMMVRWERFGSDHVIDAPDQFTRLTLDTIALCGFDYRFNSFYQNEMHPFVDSMLGVLAEAQARAAQPKLVTQLLRHRERQYQQHVELMGKISEEIVAERKHDPHAADKKDLLSRMLEAADPQTGRKLTDKNIVTQMITFLVAGHETTSSMLSFATYLMLENPHTLLKAREEVDRVLGRRTPTVNDLNDLPYLELILKESLRLWPTAPAFGLQALEDTTLGETYPVSAGQPIIVTLAGLHRDTSVWGEDVEVFRPERFLPAEFNQIPDNAYKPFGNGMRSCIGRTFALQEAHLTLALMLQRFDIMKADPSYQLKVKSTLTIKPEGFYIRAKRRGETWIERSSGLAAMQDKAPHPTGPNQRYAGETTPLLVLYGSNTGTAESFAQRIAGSAASHGYRATLATLDQYTGQLSPETPTVVVTASYEGQPTDNARQFIAWLDTLGENELDQLPFAVFGCGNRQWHRTYQAIPIKVEKHLSQAGGVPFIKRGEGDANADIFGDFDAWFELLWPALNSAIGRESSKSTGKQRLTVDVLSGSRISVMQHNDLALGTVTDVYELVNMSAAGARSKRHIEIALPEGMTYRAGDYLSVLPSNPPSNVERVFHRFSLPQDAQLTIQSDGYTTLPTGEGISALDVISNYVELGQPITHKQLLSLSALATECKAAQEFERLLKEEVYRAELLEKRVSLLDMLERFPDLDIPLATFLEMQPPLRPRQYSISSSPLWNAESCTLTIAVVDAPAWSGQGRFLGTASTYLSEATEGMPISVMVKPSNVSFHPPQDPTTPMVMVCAGSGLAPFRGFIQERAEQKAGGLDVGKAILYFGCDHPEVDYLYEDELKTWEETEVVEVRPTFSNRPDRGIQFVQHRIWEDRELLKGLYQAGAH
ncbi:MAG: cytochrome P450, partial [Chloroflexota bacterium]